MGVVNEAGDEMSMDRNLNAFYQQEALGEVDSPAVLTDKYGRILLWYLPDILGDQLKVSSTNVLRPL